MEKQMNKLVLISGSSRGLGAAMAKSFSEAGYSVAINYFNSEKIYISPNPAKDNINIFISGKDEQARLTIRSLSGSVLYDEIKGINDERTLNINLEDFTTGLYFIEITGKTIKQYSKIIKNE